MRTSLYQLQLVNLSFEKKKISSSLLRLVVMVGRKLEEKIEKYFECEVRRYPISLFKHGCSRSVQTSKLKLFCTCG